MRRGIRSELATCLVWPKGDLPSLALDGTVLSFDRITISSGLSSVSRSTRVWTSSAPLRLRPMGMSTRTRFSQEKS
jgi:hypothetical protein